MIVKLIVFYTIFKQCEYVDTVRSVNVIKYKIRDSPIKTLLNAASTLVDSKAELSRNKSLWFSKEIKVIGDSIDFNCFILDHFCSYTIQTWIYHK